MLLLVVSNFARNRLISQSTPLFLSVNQKINTKNKWPKYLIKIRIWTTICIVIQKNLHKWSELFKFHNCLLFGQKMSIIVYFDAESSTAHSLQVNTYYIDLLAFATCMYNFYSNYSHKFRMPIKSLGRHQLEQWEETNNDELSEK